MGLSACRALTPPGQNYYTPLFLLSNGFERLLKAAICFALLDKYGDYPTGDTWKPNWWKTHSPRDLLGLLLELAQVPGLRAQAILAQAGDQSSILGRMWRVIDEQSMAKVGRYHLLDVVLSRRGTVHRGRVDPAFAWQLMENDVVVGLIEAGQVTPDAEGAGHAYTLAVASIADEIGWLAWVIARMFKKWSLGDEAHLFSDAVEPLLKHEPPMRIVFASAGESPG